MVPNVGPEVINSLTASADFIFIFNSTLRSMLKIISDINKQDLKIVNLHFVKAE